MMDLLPCPFCQQNLEEIDIFETKTAITYQHPEGPCFLSGQAQVVISDRPEDAARVKQWNTRPSVREILKDVEKDDFADELYDRIRNGRVIIDDYAEMEEWDGTIELTYAGSLALNTGALDDAIGRHKRGETREALYQLEKAMDGHLNGIADLRPEDLR